MAFMMKVTVSGASGLTNAYRSVRSAYGSPAIAGASRWLEAAVSGALSKAPARSPADAARPPMNVRGRFTVVKSLSLVALSVVNPWRSASSAPGHSAPPADGVRTRLLSRPCPHASYAARMELDQSKDLGRAAISGRQP